MINRRGRVSGILWVFDPLELGDSRLYNSYDFCASAFDDVESSQDVDGVLCILFPSCGDERHKMLWRALCQHLRV